MTQLEIANLKTNGWRKLLKTSPTSFMSDHSKRHDMGLQPFNCEISNVEMYVCQNCEFTTDIAVGLKQHILQIHSAQAGTHIGSQQYLCKNCNLDTSFILVWFKHLTEGCPYNSKRRRNKTGKHSKNNEITWYNCDKCEFRTKKKYNLRRHVILKHLENQEIQWYNCDKCEYKCKTKSDLSRHKLCKHLEDHEIQWYSCHKCEFRTKIKSSLRQHNIFKHLSGDEIRWYNCDKCEFRSNNKSTLNRHRRHQHPEGKAIR